MSGKEKGEKVFIKLLLCPLNNIFVNFLSFNSMGTKNGAGVYS